ncbi:helix-turn-helix domain-containing protein [Thioalkalivibrio sulfidiphilus]|uniref:helix-turn-helix domain-containing protein n=1 Tax=Thioalkalivibrio sulfidiphilus TaxID=1033854 RepID=UPI001E4BBFE4|nr:XRE family transcriptional regulator [Thioalkalivibrio sulfidiphilus]
MSTVATRKAKPKAAGKAARPAAPEPATHAEDRNLDQHIGHVLREKRQAQSLTIADVADLAGVSRGMLSKIENGQVSTSLETLRKLSGVLGMTLAQLFKNFDVPEGGAQHVKSGEGLEVVRRGTRRGHTYHLLAYDQGPRKQVEPFLITMDDASEVFPTLTHPGVEFIYMLEGRIEYRHGRNTYLLEPGDSLTFKGSIPHGPERLLEVPIRFLAVINYGDEE